MELPIKIEGIIFKIDNNIVKYLLLKRTKKDGGFWQPMTGTVNDGETIKDCLIREMEEETNIREYLRIIKNVDFFEWKNSKNKTMIEYVFGIEIKNNLKVKISDEHDAFEWHTFKSAFEKLEKNNNKNAIIKLNKKIGGIR